MYLSDKTLSTTVDKISIPINSHAYISSDGQIAVIQMIRGGVTPQRGYPSTMYITPMEQYTKSTKFYIPPPVSSTGMVTLITSANNIANVKIDNAVNTAWVDLHQASVYKILQISLTSGMHEVVTTDAVGLFLYAEQAVCAAAYPLVMNAVPYSVVSHLHLFKINPITPDNPDYLSCL